MQEQKSKTKKRSKTLILLWSIFFIPIITVIILFTLLSKGKLGFMPDIEELQNPNTSLATEIISADGEVIATFFKENRIAVDYEDISKYAIDALVSTEDARFFEHSGVDFRGLSRVFFKTVLQGEKNAGGGSTVSQQLAKMLFPRERFASATEIIGRKFREWIIAVNLERTYTKEEIIALYLNKFDFLHNADGIKMASEVYFNTTPKDLKIEQAAMLIGMLKNPALFNPMSRPDTTLHRRNVVLSQMVKYNKLSQQEFDSLKQLPLGLDFQKIDHNFGLAPYFREWLRTSITANKPERKDYWSYTLYQQDSIRWVTDPLYGWCNKNEKAPGIFYDIYRDGLKIYTTIDSRMQVYAENAMQKHLSSYLQPAFNSENKNNKYAPFTSKLTKSEYNQRVKSSIKSSQRYRSMKGDSLSWSEIMTEFKKPRDMTVFSWRGEVDTTMSPLDSILYMKSFMQAGLLSVEPKTGYVKAFVGGINYKHFQYDHIMQQRRQVGSTFKPFLYSLAIQEGISPCHKFANVPTTFYLKDVDSTIWTPHNSDEMRRGKMVSMSWALATSNNFVSAKLMQILNPEPVISIARQMGVYNPIEPVPSICLGVADLSLYEMVGAYCTFPNKGIYTQPIFVTKIEDKYGNVLAEFTPHKKEAISEETAYTMVRMLENVVNMRGGTSVALRFRYHIEGPLAGKTGTTNDHSDGWFIGFTPELVTGIWVGGDERSIRFRSFKYGQGARMALPMFAHYMQNVIADSTALGYHPSKDFEKPESVDFYKVRCDDYGAVRPEHEPEIQQNNNINDIESLDAGM